MKMKCATYGHMRILFVATVLYSGIFPFEQRVIFSYGLFKYRVAKVTRGCLMFYRAGKIMGSPLFSDYDWFRLGSGANF